MSKNLTEIVFLLDRSGSMSKMGGEPVDGYNGFIKEQKDPTLGDANVTLVLFGSEVETVYAGVDIKTVKPFKKTKYVAEGMTSLRDAIGSTAKSIGERLANLPEEERPEKVVFVILTDGDDTSSTDFSTNDIKAIIKEQTEKYSWEFQFIGTTSESITAANSYNINAKSTHQFDNNVEGLASAYTASSAVMRSFRSQS